MKKSSKKYNLSSENTISNNKSKFVVELIFK